MIAIEFRKYGAAPVFVCDFCDRKIEGADEGLYVFDHKSEGGRTTIKLVHKGECDRALGKALGYRMQGSVELEALPIYLLRNLGVSATEAQERAQFYSGIDEPIDLLRGPTNGYVYLLKYDRFYKIGCTTNLDRRITDLDILMPEKPELIHVIECEDHSKIERRLHQNLSRYRRNGEWFELPEHIVEELKEISYA